MALENVFFKSGKEKSYLTRTPLMAPINAVLDIPTQTCRTVTTDRIRRRALERLYARRSAVDRLIESLERYQCAEGARRANCVAINSRKKS
jgi:hypothetical protein